MRGGARRFNGKISDGVSKTAVRKDQFQRRRQPCGREPEWIIDEILLADGIRTCHKSQEVTGQKHRGSGKKSWAYGKGWAWTP
jgi:hypothetical protein